MVDAPCVVDCCANVFYGKDGIAQRRAAIDGIFDLVECMRESIHVIDLLRFVSALDKVAVPVPVGRDHEDGLRPAIAADYALSYGGKGVSDIVVVEGEHGTSMAHEY